MLKNKKVYRKGLIFRICYDILFIACRCVGMADKEDSKSFASNGVRVRPPPPAPTKNALLSTKTKVRFLNDVCLRQMMKAKANDGGFA